MKVRVLAFHHISSLRTEINNYPGISTNYFKFILLILALKMCYFKFCLFEEVILFPKRRVIVLNFDDAYYSVYKKAFPFLSFFGVKAHVCITGESITGPVRGNKLPLMNLKETGVLQQKGWNFINHSQNHLALINKSETELEREIISTSEEFKNAGIALNKEYFCLPEGKSDEKTEQFILKAGYKYILSTREDLWDTNLSPIKVSRIQISSQSFLYAFYKICFKFDHQKTKPVKGHNIAGA